MRKREQRWPAGLWKRHADKRAIMQNDVLHHCEVIRRGFAKLRKGVGQNDSGKIEPASFRGGASVI
jgi:hypothetical protein